jgi:hypothetical protein
VSAADKAIGTIDSFGLIVVIRVLQNTPGERLFCCPDDRV